MLTSPAQHQARIDSLMEQASQQLVHRRYFEAEELCLEALRKAHALRDFDRMARILLPLQEARRQKRDQAVDSGAVFLVDKEVPSEASLVPGCYLVSPPRVGVDGRLLREAADRTHVPVLVIVREPATRDGLWPVVAVGPVTLRTKVQPPATPPQRATTAPKGKAPKKGTRAKAAVESPASAPAVPIAPLPTPEWFIAAGEALGDSGIAAIPPAAHATSRVDVLLEMLEALPDHEKLHQALEAAARASARDPRPPRRPAPALVDDEDESGDGADS